MSRIGSPDCSDEELLVNAGDSAADRAGGSGDEPSRTLEGTGIRRRVTRSRRLEWTHLAKEVIQ